ncbi:ankyrin repeat and protein kinase domain-containing protein 1-like isoform X2 [Nelusetta ayraudi]|uniref:ankyrin repeat and protein kinase domain-containing protein 1-like isoform X2 n=1 Tax=Nelusetta ayraudi TaxID=303726 RepID=UPI003F6F9369
MGDLVNMVGDDSLDQWICIGSGGFGAVFKAHHKHWGFDVAIKILREDPRDTELWREAKYMEKAACKFVLRFHGLYQGRIPLVAATTQWGIVMDFMERGSVQSLLTSLSGPPPWPLAFRIVHQIAQGMNFLHSRELMHHDLHPNNVLLDENLNAKVADFGLSRVSTSVSMRSSGTDGDNAGSYKYKPPEAFDESYQPSRAYDRYSYGILLWSILTAKEVYPGCDSSLVALRIQKGDRPRHEDIDVGQADGLKEMVDLMKSLWDGNAAKRSTFKECCGVTGHVFSLHKEQIHVTVHDVLKLLDSESNDQLVTPRVPGPPLHESVQGCGTPLDLRPTGRIEDVWRSVNQHSRVPSPTREKSNYDKAQFVDDNRDALIQSVAAVMAVTDELKRTVHREIYKRIFKEESSENKMRLLYLDVLDEGSERVKAAFYDAVRKHQFGAIEKLGGN